MTMRQTFQGISCLEQTPDKCSFERVQWLVETLKTMTSPDSYQYGLVSIGRCSLGPAIVDRRSRVEGEWRPAGVLRCMHFQLLGLSRCQDSFRIVSSVRTYVRSTLITLSVAKDSFRLF
jgi:hypothetical protein